MRGPLASCVIGTWLACSPQPAPVSSSRLRQAPPTTVTAPRARTAFAVHLEQLTQPGPTSAETRTVWLYRPDPLPDQLGLVLVAPAGSNLVTGMPLADDDRREHTPYARAGFAVVAYSIDGVARPNATDAEIERAMSAYMASQAGVANARVALDLALVKLRSVDRRLIFVAGHSSAGAHALLLATQEPRIRGVVVYAPATRLDAPGLDGMLSLIEQRVPGFTKFVTWSMPVNRVLDFSVPIFVFQARDDSVIPPEHTDDFVERLRAAGKTVEYVQVDRGDHYPSMIEQGLAKGVAWLDGKRRSEAPR